MFHRSSGIFIFIILLWTCFYDCKSQTSKYRLPTDIAPIHYNLLIKIDIYQQFPSDFTFDGKVDILILCKNSTSTIKLHTLDLTIPKEDIQIGSIGNDATQIKTVREDSATQVIMIDLEAPLVAGGRYRISLSFNSRLKRFPKFGLFYGSYTNGSHTDYMVGNMGEATYTRMIFPCFDEPAMRATFNISILRKNRKKSISNMPLRQTDPRENGWFVDRFEQTPNMSTYLLSFIVTESNFMEKFTSRGLRIRMYARPNEMERAEFALNLAVTAMEPLETYFGTPFPLPKLDMIEIPEYPFTGLETWGAIQFQPETVLLDAERQNYVETWEAAKIVLHELVHSWIGNLVSLEWWDGIWIKEGLATFLELVAVEMALPGWNMEGIFYSTIERETMEKDAMSTAKPVHRMVETPDEIERLYAFTWSYRKSASLFRMVYYAIGPDKFKLGIQKLLHDHAGSTMNNQILWDTFQSVSGINISLSMVMKEWLTTTGYPLVILQGQTHLGDMMAKQFHIGYRQYNFDICRNTRCGSRWVIPVTIKADIPGPYDSKVVRWQQNSYSMYTGSQVIPPGAMWIVLNTFAGGYYRVKYDDWYFNKIVEQLHTDHTAIPEFNRAQFVGDAFKINRYKKFSRRLEADSVLQLLSYLRNETSPAVWVMVQEQLQFWFHRLGGTFAEHNFMDFISHITGTIYTRLGIEVNTSEPLDNRYMRKSVVSLNCRTRGYCSTDALSLFTTWMNNKTKLFHADVEREVMSVAVRDLGESAMEHILTKSQRLSTLDNKYNYIRAAAATVDPSLARSLLDMSLTSSWLHTENLVYYMSLRAVTADVAWTFIKEKINEIRQLYGRRTVGYVKDWLEDFAKTFDTNGDLEKLDEMETVLSRSFSNLKAAFESARTTTKKNRAWKDGNLSRIYDWLREWKLTINNN